MFVCPFGASGFPIVHTHSVFQSLLINNPDFGSGYVKMAGSKTDPRLPTINIKNYDHLIQYTLLKTFHKTRRLLFFIARNILLTNPVEFLAPAEKIVTLLSTLLPVLVSVFTDNFFIMPPFSIRVVKETASLYGLSTLSSNVLSYLTKIEMKETNAT